jgi:arylsulfatase A-like enzyme
MLKKALLLLALALPAAAAEKPNIIFILTDDLGWGDYGSFFQNLRKEKGDRSEPWHMTPQLDNMAAEGLKLPHHYCPAPVCAPSRASLLLGVHQGHSEIRDNQFDKELPDNHTLATVMKGAGYATAAFGKWGLQGGPGQKEKKGDNLTPKDWPGYPPKRGFDFFHGYVRHRDGHAHYPKEDGKEVWENDDEISAGLDACYTADLFTARAKKWIADLHAADAKKPFFAYLAFDTPHAKTQLPAAPYPQGGGLKGGIQWLGKKGHMINTAGGKPDSWFHPDYASATWDADKDPSTPEVAWPDVYKRYATSVRRIDDCVGDIIHTLEDLGIDGNTLIVFTTDNGPSQESYLKQPFDADFFNSFGPFDGIKRDLLEGGIRVGAIARWPDFIAPDSTRDIPSQFHDWMPTFAELGGVAAPARADGTSLLPTIARMGSQKDPQVYVEYSVNNNTPKYPEFAKQHRGAKRGQMQAIRLGDFIGVRFQTKSHADPFEIYNIVSDPQETKNLAKDMPELQEKMHATVLRMRRPNKTAPRPYDDIPVPAVEADSSPGVAWASYANESPWLARLDDLTPTSEGTSETISDAAPTADAALFSGYIEIPAGGAYTFHLPAKALALLRIHEATVIDAAYAPSEKESSGTIILAKGKHPFRLYWKNGETKPAIEISGPDMERTPVPKEMLRH